MALIATRFDGYFIDNRTFRVYSNKSGRMREMTVSLCRDARKKNPKPYKQVGVRGCTLLHRIIADTFISNVDGLTVNHKNGNTLDNRLKNLEVVTMEENQAHAKREGLLPTGEKHGRCRYTDKQILVALKEIKKGASVKSTAKKYGITQSYLNKIKNGVYRVDLHSKVFKMKL